jgi:hypothetical protein
MSRIIACRSPIQIAEDNLLMLATRSYNVSRAEAQHFRIQMRELTPKSSAKARELVNRWEGTDADIRECDALLRLRIAELLH